jgi:hypothetical protein
VLEAGVVMETSGSKDQMFAISGRNIREVLTMLEIGARYLQLEV